jgi:hypothetical protein
MIKNVRLKNFWNPQIFTHALPRTERISFSKILELMNQLFLSFLIHISFPNRILLKTTKVVFLYKQFSLFCSLISFKVSFALTFYCALKDFQSRLSKPNMISKSVSTILPTTRPHFQNSGCIQFNLLSTFQSQKFIADFFGNFIQNHMNEN